MILVVLNMKKMRNDKKFCIDFFELSFLIEACIPPNPIARSMFWKEVIDEYYHEMSDDEHKRLYEWISMNPGYQHSLKGEHEDCLLFEARFNPDNQYEVLTDYEGKKETYKCFKYKDRYHTSSTTSILEKYIKEIKKCGE